MSEWKPIESAPREEIPTAIREDVMKLGDFEFRVYVLDDGRRVINADDMRAVLELFGQISEDDLPNPPKEGE